MAAPRLLPCDILYCLKTSTTKADKTPRHCISTTKEPKETSLLTCNLPGVFCYSNKKLKQCFKTAENSNTWAAHILNVSIQILLKNVKKLSKPMGNNGNISTTQFDISWYFKEMSQLVHNHYETPQNVNTPKKPINLSHWFIETNQTTQNTW